MNIFVLDRDPVIAAQMQCDKHVVKMSLESAQMLCTVHRKFGGTTPELYKATHSNHPCTLWAGLSVSNYNWLYQHFIALCDEYTFRYGKVCMVDTKFRQLLSTPPVGMPEGDLTPFAICMKNQPECIVEDPVESYKMFYLTKSFSMKWTKRDTPSWFASALTC
jgi:hypothetical protein